MGSSSKKDRRTNTASKRNNSSPSTSRQTRHAGNPRAKGKVSFPAYLEIPRDPDDYRYTYSFDANADEAHGVDHASWSANVKEFYDDYGFVVLRNVLTQEDCTKTLDTIWTTLESQVVGMNREDSSTWEKWHSPFGLPGRAPRFETQLLQNRQSEALYQLCSTVMGDPDILISQDRWTLYRPNGNERTSWQTRSNVHLDMNPWRYQTNDRDTEQVLSKLTYKDTSDFIRENNLVTKRMGTVIQGVMNLSDNLEEDGGFIVIPGFHKHFDTWLNSLDASVAGAFSDKGSYRFDAYPQAMRLAQRVTLRAGSVVVWDQRCAHGSKVNRSHRSRAAQFFKCTPARALSHEQLQHRSRSVQKLLRDHEFADQVTPTGRIVFGLNHIK